MCFILFHVITIFTYGLRCHGAEYLEFPKDFLIGAATSSHQIEGAWNVSDKSENVWDRFTHHPLSTVHNKSTADVACNSYYLYKEDVKLLENIGFDFYRFSISWARILPNGFANYISKDGIKYYHNLLDELELKGIEPYVTIYHWDHPQVLEDLGGWTNELMVQWFTDYARVIFEEFGPRVKVFFTINEPFIYCTLGYGATLFAPGKNLPGVASYMCGHNALKAHASVYHLYDEKFRKDQKGIIGIVNVCEAFVTGNKDHVLEDEAFQLNCGWFSHPIFSKKGDYPKVMKKLVKEISISEGWPRSRLPKFDKKWIKYIRGTSDFYALNHYTTSIIERRNGTKILLLPDLPATSGPPSTIIPKGFRYILRRLKAEYGDIPIYITENGYPDKTQAEEAERINYHFSYLKEMLKAIYEDGCNIKAYTVWSLMDNFEWAFGYSVRYGIVHVDFDDASRKRTPKYSATWFKKLLKLRKLSLQYS